LLAGQLLLAAGVPVATVQKAQRIILATADHHHLEGDADGDVVVDAGEGFTRMAFVLERRSCTQVECYVQWHASHWVKTE
jgi:hypothetical protein